MARQREVKASPVRAGKASRTQRGLGRPPATISTKRPSQRAWPKTKGKRKTIFERRSALGGTPPSLSLSISARS